ncbi:MAG: hypothetical protein HDS64_10350 [Bacteroidales bacterium]|nr:hypothetical protein [Bacteroidales bacterium]MBD5341836.1 hypothetical protein [Bacteroides sp.]MBD5359587.1 hypothetical protein [Bacteroides sp.]
MKPIDAVILWVDGSDPAIVSKHKQYSVESSELKRNDIGGIARYTDNREIEYCVSSILTFAPFIRNIFIITDNQDPGLDDMLNTHFPDGKTSVKIIDHKVIFRDYEHFLPSFNTNSLETMMWRIPNLSEQFVYFNDDVFLAAPTNEEDFFSKNGLPIGYWRPINRRIAGMFNFFKKGMGFKHFIINSARMINADIIPLLGHTPMPLTRSGFKRIFEQHPEWMELNLKDRFRNPRQFNPQALYYLMEPNVRRDFIDLRIFFKPKASKSGYMARKIRQADKMRHLLFGCINSFEECNETERQLFYSWFTKRLNNVYS